MSNGEGKSEGAGAVQQGKLSVAVLMLQCKVRAWSSTGSTHAFVLTFGDTTGVGFLLSIELAGTGRETLGSPIDRWRSIRSVVLYKLRGAVRGSTAAYPTG